MNTDAVILARVSSREQEETGYSLPAQEKYLRDYCLHKQLNAKKVFCIAESASGKKQRDDFDSMITYANKYGIKHLVVEKVDRLTRNFKDAVMIDDWLHEDEERQLHLVKDSLVMHKNSRSQEKLNWGVRIIFAKNYIDNLKEEVDKGMKEKLAQGWLPAPPPPGYKTVGDKGHKIHVVDETIAPLAKLMFEAYDSGEHSIKTLTDFMTEKGLRTRTGHPYGKSGIHTLLGNPFYIGKNRWMGKLYDGKQEPVLSQELFERVQARLRGKTAPKYSKHNPLFKGIINCIQCGGVITWQQQKGHWYGRCNGYRGCPQGSFVRQEDLEKQLTSVFDQLASPSPAIVDWVKDALREKHQTDIDVHKLTAKQLRERHDYLRRRIDIMYDDRVDGRLSPQKYDLKVKEAEAEQSELIAKLGGLDGDYMAKLEHGINVLELSQHAADIYLSKEDPDRRALLRDIFSNLSLNGQTLGYTYSPLAAAIADKSEKQRQLNKKFEQAEKGPTKRKEALIGASRTLWLRRPDSNRRPID